MAETWTQTSQMTIKDLADFGRSLAATVARQPEADRLRAAIDQALAAECVQCAIRLSGSEVLKFGEETSDDARVERLRVGYCARNGCESLFYRTTCVAHPQVNWPALLNPAHEMTLDEKAAAELRAKQAEARRRNMKTLLRTAAALGALLMVFIIRQVYVGGTIPLFREPEEFRVDVVP